MDKIPVAILGATGNVGQMFIHLLNGHPLFKVEELAASEKSAGKKYIEAVKGRWHVSSEIPENIADLEVKECKPNLKSRIVFSALDSSVAKEIEEIFAEKGYFVISNTSAHRMEKDVPIVIPEVNPEHLELIKFQKSKRGWKGFIVAKPNCSTIHLCLALKPIYDSFGLESVLVFTMQALSGAGYPGISSLDIIDNVIPYIKNEEEKIQIETLKIFGKIENGEIKNANFSISAHCNRINVSDGHTEAVSIKLKNKAEIEDIKRAFKEFNPLRGLNLYMAPSRPIVLREEEDRPQPKLDRNLEKGMASIIGRIRKCNVLDYKFVLLGHNLIRGAAGGALLIAEYMNLMGYFDEI